MERSTYHFSWENPLFRLGHFPLLFVCSPEGKSHLNPMKNHHFPMVFLWFSYGFPFQPYFSPSPRPLSLPQVRLHRARLRPSPCCVESPWELSRGWVKTPGDPRSSHQNSWDFIHWIGLRENLQETMVFTIKLIGFSCKFSHHPIL